MSNEDGFTLFELILALTIFMLMVTVIGSFHSQTFDNIQFQRWYKQFEKDTLYLQQSTMISRSNDYLMINPSQHSYEINSGALNDPTIKREFPTDWDVSLQSLRMPLTFTRNGTIRNPGMFRIHTNHHTYDIYFPFGKGRSYYVKR